MKQRVLLTATLVILGTLALTAMLAQAQTISNGPYYATPSWDQKLQCDALATCPRFVVLANWSNGAVLDRETGLVWEQSPASDPNNTFQWVAAQNHCRALGTGNRIGWRLPTIQELSSLVEVTGTDPFFGPQTTLPAGHPFTVQASVLFWSATTNAGNTALVFTLNLPAGIGGPLPLFKTSPASGVWCVRSSAPGSDPQ